MTSLKKLFQNNIILSSLLLLVLLNVGCTKDDTMDISGGDTVLELSVRSSAMEAADANLLFPEELIVRSIRVLTFNRYNSAGDPDFEKNQYAEAGGNSFTVQNGIYKVKMSVKEHTNKDIYVLINEPAALKATLDNITTVADLNALQYTLANYFTGSDLLNSSFCINETTTVATFNNLPMFGKALSQSIVADASGMSATSIVVQRAFARVDLRVKKESDQPIVVSNASTFEHTTYANGNLTDLQHTTAAEHLSTQTKTFGGSTGIDVTSSEFTRILSFYTPARTVASPEETIKITLGNISYGGDILSFPPITLDESIESGVISEIMPGTIYEINATFKSRGITADINIWSAADVDTDIEGEAFVKAPATVLMDFAENDTHYKVVPYTGSGDVRIIVDGSVIAVGESLISAGNAPKWLESAVWSTRSADGKSGTLTFKYKMSSEDIEKPFLAKLNCGGAVRVMSVKYADTAMQLLPINLIDYSKFTDLTTGERGSFTTRLYFNEELILPTRPEWLTEAAIKTVGAEGDQRQFLEITYKPTATLPVWNAGNVGRGTSATSTTSHPVYIISEKYSAKKYELIYDNGFITPEIMAESESANGFLGFDLSAAENGLDPSTAVGRNGWAPNGFHLAKRGWMKHNDNVYPKPPGQQYTAEKLTGCIDPFVTTTVAHAYEDGSTPIQMKASTDTEIPDNEFMFNLGASYTATLISRFDENTVDATGAYEHWIAKYCEKPGTGYYAPNVCELHWIKENASKYLGRSYTYKAITYWSTSEFYSPTFGTGRGINVQFEIDNLAILASTKIGKLRTRCIKNL